MSPRPMRTLTPDELADLRLTLVQGWHRQALPIRTTSRPLCPVCSGGVIRFQRSGPPGSTAGDGPVIAYPCNHWIPWPEGGDE